jgi:hypothetical protein
MVFSTLVLIYVGLSRSMLSSTLGLTQNQITFLNTVYDFFDILPSRCAVNSRKLGFLNLLFKY